MKLPDADGRKRFPLRPRQVATNELKLLDTQCNENTPARIRRRKTYIHHIAGHPPLTTEALVVAISAVAFVINDPAPPSVLTIRRWLYLYRHEQNGNPHAASFVSAHSRKKSRIPPME